MQRRDFREAVVFKNDKDHINNSINEIINKSTII